MDINELRKLVKNYYESESEAELTRLLQEMERARQYVGSQTNKVQHAKQALASAMKDEDGPRSFILPDGKMLTVKATPDDSDLIHIEIREIFKC